MSKTTNKFSPDHRLVGNPPKPGSSRRSRHRRLSYRLTHQCHIVDTGNDSFRFKASTAKPRTRKEKTLA